MKILLVYISFFICIPCYLISNNSEIKGIKILSINPALDLATGKFSGYDTSCAWIFSKDKLIINSFEYPFDSIYSRMDEVDSAPKIISKISEKRYEFLVYEVGKKYGLLYNQHKTPQIREVNLDSIVKTYWIYQTVLDSFFLKKNMELSSREGEKGSGLYKESWFTKGDDEVDQINVTLIYKPKSQNIEYSFSKSLDTVKGMKLVGLKYELLMKRGYEIGQDFVMELFIQDYNGQKLSEVQEYFTRFKEDSKRFPLLTDR